MARQRETHAERYKRTQKEKQAAELAAQKARAEELRWEAQREIYRTRLQSDEAYQRHEELWRVEVDADYRPHVEFLIARQRFRDGKPSDAEELVRFLERDPWLDCSGYFKAHAIRFLKRIPLTQEQEHRLRQVALASLTRKERPWRREQKDYGRLARRVDSPELRAALGELFKSEDAGTRVRARWMLDAVQQRNERKAEVINDPDPDAGTGT